MDENNIFDKYKQWRQKLLDDSEGMDALKMILLGLFIASISMVLAILGGKDLYLMSRNVFFVGYAIGAVGIILINYLVIKRSQWVKWVRNFFNK